MTEIYLVICEMQYWHREYINFEYSFDHSVDSVWANEKDAIECSEKKNKTAFRDDLETHRFYVTRFVIK